MDYLTASAPELLEACKRVELFMLAMTPIEGQETDYMTSLNIVKQAIAKAESK